MFISCDSRQTTDLDVVDINTFSAEIFPGCLPIEKIEYVPLETDGVPFLNDQIDRFRIFENKFFLIEYNNLDRRIFSFSSDGKYIMHIDNPGEGPGKYLKVQDLWYDSNEESLELLDSYQNKIIRYNLKGEYLYQYKISNSFSEFVKIEKETYVYYASNSPSSTSNDNIYLVKENETVNTFVPIQENLGEIHFMGPRFTKISNEKHLFYETLNDTIYEIGPNLEFKAKAIVDLGKFWISFDEKDRFLNSSIEERLDFLNKSGKTISMIHPNYYHDTYLLSFIINAERRRYLYMQASDSQGCLTYTVNSTTKYNEFDYGPIPNELVYTSGNKLYFLIQPYTLKSAVFESNPIEKDMESLERYNALLKISQEIDVNDNSIVMIVSLNI